MNTIDDRITAALHARADALTEADLSPATPPTSRVVQPDRFRWSAPLLAAAVVGIVAVGTVVAVQLSRSSQHAAPAVTPSPPSPSPSVVVPTPAPSRTGPAPSQSASQGSRPPLTSQPPSTVASPPTPSRTRVSPTGSASQPPATVVPPAFTLGYEPLWPFASYAEAEQWRTTAGGSQPWRLDPGLTALDFTGLLGLTDITQIVETRLDELGAHVAVGYRDPNGAERTAATLHLVRFGTAKDSPWEVVGSDDTTLSLEQPGYGSQVRSPMTIGGHITGVDENIVVSLIRIIDGNSAESRIKARVPAGGDHAVWTTGPVSFTDRGVLILLATTGGHLQQVERFAIHGVHT